MTGDFQKKLKKLNKTLEVHCFVNSKNFPGLHYTDKTGEKIKICSVAYDGGWINEHSQYDNVGHVIHPGWRRAVLALLKHDITTPALVNKVFPGFFLRQDPTIKIETGDSIANAINKKKAEKMNLTGKDAFDKEDIREIASKIEANETEAEKAKLEQQRWNLQEWAKRGGAPSDRPKGFDLK